MKTCKRGHEYETSKKQCPVCRIANIKRWQTENKEHNATNKKRWNTDNKERQAANNKRWQSDNKELNTINQKCWYLKNKEQVIEKNRLYKTKRRANDPLFKLRQNISSLIYISFKNQGWSKSAKTQTILGCNFKTFETHLIQSAIKNYGYWADFQTYEFDHVTPVAVARDETHLIELNHYTNFQLLYPKDNLEKSDKLNWTIPKV